jgi:hypothetical protein
VGGNVPAEVCIRWRGVVDGPYTAEELEAKLEARQIGMLHEVQVAEGWISLRQYLARREAMRRSSLLAAAERASLPQSQASLAAPPRAGVLATGKGLLFLACGGAVLPPLAWVACVLAFLQMRKIPPGARSAGGYGRAKLALVIGVVVSLLWLAGLGAWLYLRKLPQ